MTVESITVHAVPSELCGRSPVSPPLVGDPGARVVIEMSEKGVMPEREGLRDRGQTQSGWVAESSGGVGRVCGHTRLWC